MDVKTLTDDELLNYIRECTACTEEDNADLLLAALDELSHRPSNPLRSTKTAEQAWQEFKQFYMPREKIAP